MVAAAEDAHSNKVDSGFQNDSEQMDSWQVAGSECSGSQGEACSEAQPKRVAAGSWVGWMEALH